MACQLFDNYSNFRSTPKSLIFHDKGRPRIVDFLMGLGGRDVTVGDFIAMVERAKKKKDETYEYYGVRE